MLARLPSLSGAIRAAYSWLNAPRAKTGDQSKSGVTLEEVVSGLSADVYTDVAGGALQRTYMSCPDAGIATWRRMLQNPTIALGLAAAKAPAKAAKWTVVADKGAPSGAEDLIAEWVLPLRPIILRDGMRCVEYGWQPFETIWDIVKGRMVPARLKPLLPDITDILTDKSGRFTGLDNRGVTLKPIDSLVVHVDGEAGDMHGRSRLENIREKAWWPWEETLVRRQQYLMKAAGIIPRVTYPQGESTGANGVKTKNSELARLMIASMQRGGGVCMPFQLAAYAEGLLAKGYDPAKLLAWQIDFLEARNTHGTELDDSMGKDEARMVRGLLVPERAILEGQNGTKAEAGEHGGVGISVAQDLLDQVLCIVNWHLVDKVLVLNYGPEAAGTVRIEAGDLADETKAVLTEILKGVLTNASNVDVLLSMLDLEAAMEQVGLPMLPQAKQPEPTPESDKQGDKPPTDKGNDLAASIRRAAEAFRKAT